MWPLAFHKVCLSSCCILIRRISINSWAASTLIVETAYVESKTFFVCPVCLQGLPTQGLIWTLSYLKSSRKPARNIAPCATKHLKLPNSYMT